MHAYMKQMWSIIEPGTLFQDGWHIGAMCEHEEAVLNGDIRNLLITICPRFTKSITTSIAMPTYAWIKRPTTRFLFGSYSSSLSLEHAVTSRRVIQSSWYQSRWPLSLVSDQNVKGYYENAQRGYRISTSVGGSATGRGGDILVTDDPHNLENIESNDVREGDKRWYFKVWSTRLNNPRTGRKIVIMQRGHQDDLAAVLIESGDYTHLNLPTEYVPTPWVSVTGWSDPRREPGELLNEERFGAEENARAKTELGPIDYSAQHSQDPLPESGGMFERKWFEIIEPHQVPGELAISNFSWADPHLQHHTPGRLEKKCRGWDAAGTEGAGDWTVGALVGISKSNIVYILDIVRAQVAENEDLMMQCAKLDGRGTLIREEQEGGSGGKRIIALHKKTFVGYDYDGERATGEKHTRWKTLASYSRPAKGEVYGNVKIVSGSWNKVLLDEFVAGRRSKHDDQLDAVSLAFNEITLGPGKLKKRKARWG